MRSTWCRICDIQANDIQHGSSHEAPSDIPKLMDTLQNGLERLRAVPESAKETWQEAACMVPDWVLYQWRASSGQFVKLEHGLQVEISASVFFVSLKLSQNKKKERSGLTYAKVWQKTPVCSGLRKEGHFYFIPAFFSQPWGFIRQRGSI